jgi:hypothetical protein
VFKVARGTRLGSLAAVNPSLFSTLDDLVEEDVDDEEEVTEDPNCRGSSPRSSSSASSSPGDWG